MVETVLIFLRRFAIYTFLDYILPRQGCYVQPLLSIQLQPRKYIVWKIYTSTDLSHIHHLTCGISFLLHSVNLIMFTLLLVHLILHISPHHSHHLPSHHLSLPLPSTPDLKLISFTNPFLHSHSYSFRTAFTDLNLYWIKGALALVCFSVIFFVFFNM